MAYDPNMIMNFVNQNNNGLLTGIGQGINQLVTNKRDERQAAADMEAYQGLLTSAIRPEDGIFNPKGWMDAINSAPDSEKEKVIQMYNVAKAEEEQRLSTIAEGEGALSTARWEAAKTSFSENIFDPDVRQEFLAAGLEIGLLEPTQKMVDDMTTSEQDVQLTQNLGFLGSMYAGKPDKTIADMEETAQAYENEGKYGDAEKLREFIVDMEENGTKDAVSELTVQALMFPGGKDAVDSLVKLYENERENIELGWAATDAERRVKQFEMDRKSWSQGLSLARNNDNREERATQLAALNHKLNIRKTNIEEERKALEARRVLLSETEYGTDLEREKEETRIKTADQELREREAVIADADLELRQAQAKRQDTELSIKVMTAANEIGTAEEIDALNKMAIDDPEFGEDILGMLRYATIRDNGGAAASSDEFNDMIRTQRNDFLKGAQTYFDTETLNGKLRSSLNAAKNEANPASAGLADITSINSFQQMIDDATVREGDVVLMQSANSFAQKMALWVQNKEEGDQLSQTQRDQMAALSGDLVAAEKKYVDVVIVPSLQLANKRVDPSGGTYEEVFAGWFDPKEDATYGAADASGLTAQNIEQATAGTENYEER